MKSIKYILAFILILTFNDSYACSCKVLPEINNKEDFKNYTFIALAEVDSIYESSVTKMDDHDIFHEISFSIIELYKGETRDSIMVNGGHRNLDIPWTSCDMGIIPAEQWVIFGYKDDRDNVRTEYCTYSVLYKDKSGQRDWLYRDGIDEVKILREIYGIDIKNKNPKNGTHQIQYPNGQTEIIETYRNNLLHGNRKLFYASGQIMSEQSYYEGEKNGTFLWYNSEGTVIRKYQYLNDQPAGTCMIYYRNGQLNYRRTFDINGTMLHNQKYDHQGNLKESDVYNPISKKRISTNYYSSGGIHYISISNANYESLMSTEFYETGEIEKKFIYFPDSPQKNRELKEWNRSGNLIRHIIFWNDRNQVILDETSKK